MRNFKNADTKIYVTESELVEMYKREFKENEVTEYDYSDCKTLQELYDAAVKNNDNEASNWIESDNAFEEVEDED